MTSEELIYLIENKATERNIRAVAENLLEAINDWPIVNLKEPNELISELKKEINNRLTFENINGYLKTLSPEKDSWKMESLSSILEIFHIERHENVDVEIELEKLLERIMKL